MVLHVGLPKSGTTFLQQSLAANREVLGDRGVLYPQTDDDMMFRAALDVRGNHKAWGRKRREVEGAWDELCLRARHHVGTTVISHELLAAASRHQVDAATTMLKGLEVHVVVTVRDLARQLVAEWQEGIKHGRRLTFEEFHARVGTSHVSGDDSLARHFFAAQDLAEVLDRWGRWLPEKQVHVVVGAPEGAQPGVLWAHFAEVVGFDPDGFPPAEARRTNASLGVDEIDLLRRVNIALDGRLRQPAYGRLAKHRVAHELLAGQGSARPVLPAQLYAAVTDVAERWCKEVRKAGYTVHGDLDDLLPVRADREGTHPDETSAPAQREVAAAVIAELLLDLEQAQAATAHQEEKRRSWKKQAKKLKVRLAELGG
ncbi:MAG: hypothetical protein ACXWDI_09975 [Nocardioides sp.]